MSRDGLPRAYLRIDPNIDHAVADLDGFIRLLCSAARQPERGRFRERAILDRAVGRAKVARMIERGDVITLPDGRFYVAGWDEWQEGDLTVGERMKRMRARRKTVSRVTPTASPARNDVTTDASTKGESSSSSGDGDGFTPSPAERGRRKDGTNPRAVGTSPRQTGSSPRQVKEEDRRQAPVRLHAILEAAAKRRPA